MSASRTPWIPAGKANLNSVSKIRLRTRAHFRCRCLDNYRKPPRDLADCKNRFSPNPSIDVDSTWSRVTWSASAKHNVSATAGCILRRIKSMKRRVFVDLKKQIVKQNEEIVTLREALTRSTEAMSSARKSLEHEKKRRENAESHILAFQDIMDGMESLYVAQEEAFKNGTRQDPDSCFKESEVFKQILYKNVQTQTDVDNHLLQHLEQLESGKVPREPFQFFSKSISPRMEPIESRIPDPYPEAPTKTRPRTETETGTKTGLETETKTEIETGTKTETNTGTKTEMETRTKTEIGKMQQSTQDQIASLRAKLQIQLQNNRLLQGKIKKYKDKYEQLKEQENPETKQRQEQSEQQEMKDEITALNAELARMRLTNESLKNYVCFVRETYCKFFAL